MLNVWACFFSSNILDPWKGDIINLLFFIITLTFIIIHFTVFKREKIYVTLQSQFILHRWVLLCGGSIKSWLMALIIAPGWRRRCHILQQARSHRCFVFFSPLSHLLGSRLRKTGSFNTLRKVKLLFPLSSASTWHPYLKKQSVYKPESPRAKKYNNLSRTLWGVSCFVCLGLSPLRSKPCDPLLCVQPEVSLVQTRVEFKWGFLKKSIETPCIVNEWANI